MLNTAIMIAQDMPAIFSTTTKLLNAELSLCDLSE